MAKIAKIVFLPVSVAAGLLSGLIAKRLFGAAWTLVDKQAPPPRPQQREIRLGKLALALGLEGAVFRLVRGLVDHSARRGVAGLVGSWPGEERSADE